MPATLHILIWISIYSIGIVFLVALLTKKSKSKTSKLFYAYIVLATLTEAVMTYLAIHHINNLWISHIYYPIEFGLLAFLLSTFTDVKKWAVSLAVIYFASMHLFSDFNTINVFAYCLQSLMLFLLSLRILVLTDIKPIEQRFWITIAILIYMGCTSLTVPLKMNGCLEAFYIELVFNLIANILMGISFLWKRI